MYEVDRRLWLNQDRTKVVEEGDPEAALLLATKGKRLPIAEARRLGLVEDKPQEIETPQEAVATQELDKEPETEEKAVTAAEVEDKAVNAPGLRRLRRQDSDQLRG